MSKEYTCARDSQSKHNYGRDNQNSARKGSKMARFWPKWRYNGRVMAREVFFHQCLWVTKFCAKFGRSRIPRTARAPNSFIILRCMWKEPAPLNLVEILMYGWDFKVNAYSRFRNWSLIKICVQLVIHMNSTHRSAVPLAMFHNTIVVSISWSKSPV